MKVSIELQIKLEKCLLIRQNKQKVICCRRENNIYKEVVEMTILQNSYHSLYKLNNPKDQENQKVTN